MNEIIENNLNYVEAIINGLILLMLVISAFAVVFSKNLLNGLVYLSFFSIIMSVAYLFLNAPDVAITEAAIGAGISSFLLLLVLSITGEKQRRHKFNVISCISLFLIAFSLFYAILGMPDFGDANSVATTEISSYFLKNSYEEIGIPNVVTSVLASYRGFDTMGEVFVIFAAGISVAMLVGSEFLFATKNENKNATKNTIKDVIKNTTKDAIKDVNKQNLNKQSKENILP